MRPHPSAPKLQQPVAPHLPIDTPPRPSKLPPIVLTGLSWEHDAGTTDTHVGRPWTPYVAPGHFPLVMPSAAGPASIRPSYGFSLNRYSPVPHVRNAEAMETRPVGRTTRLVYAGVAKGTQRVRGQVIPSPPVTQTWRNVFTGRQVT